MGGGGLSDRNDALIRRGKDTRVLCPLSYTAEKRAQQEGSRLQARKRVLPRNRISQHLDQGLPDSRTVRK